MPGLISCAGVTRDGDCYASVNICTMHVEHGYQMLRVEHKLNTCIHRIHMHAVHAIVHCTSLFPTPTVMCVPSDLNCWSWNRVWTPSLEKWPSYKAYRHVVADCCRTVQIAQGNNLCFIHHHKWPACKFVITLAYADSMINLHRAHTKKGGDYQ